jgi:hypothetical protein
MRRHNPAGKPRRSQLRNRPLPVVLGNIRATASGTMLAINSLRMSSVHTNPCSPSAHGCPSACTSDGILGSGSVFGMSVSDGLPTRECCTFPHWSRALACALSALRPHRGPRSCVCSLPSTYSPAWSRSARIEPPVWAGTCRWSRRCSHRERTFWTVAQPRRVDATRKCRINCNETLSPLVV